MRYEWFALQRWGADYWQEFEQAKDPLSGHLRETELRLGRKGLLPRKHVLLDSDRRELDDGLLNSTAVEWFYGMISNRLRGGYLRAFSDYMEQIPIPPANRSRSVRH